MRTQKCCTLVLIVLLACINGFPQIPGSGIIGYYPIDGNADDMSGNENHGIVYGAALTKDRCNVDNSAYAFDDGNEYITAGDITEFDGSNALTLSAWIYTEGIIDEHSGTIISKYSTSGQSERVFLLDVARYGENSLRFIIYGADGNADWEQEITTVPIQLSSWNHVVATWDGLTHIIEIYINGIKVNSDYSQNGNKPDRIYNKSSPFMIGACESGYTSPDYLFNGSIDEVLTYNRVLTEEEILRLYYFNCEKYIPVAFYPFNGNANDESGNENHGIVHGAVLTTDRCNIENSAYFFDGYDDYIELPSSVAINTDSSFSISAWFCNYSITSDGKYSDNAIFGQTDGDYSSDYPVIILQIEQDNTVRGAIRGTDYPSLEVRTTVPVQNNTWYHVVMVRNALKDSLSLYINGELVKKNSDVLSGNTSTNDFVSLGAYFDDLQRIFHYFHGKIDDVMIIDKSLTNEEVKELYTYNCLTDIDGNIYSTLEICGQIWMAENLKTTRFNDGTSIPLVTNRSDWIDRTDPGMCTYNFTTDEDFIGQYGRLYNWYAVNTDKLCPSGYHVPSDEEWKELEKCLCMSKVERDKIGPRGTDQGSQIAGNGPLWTSGDLEASNNFGEVGFNAVPAGFLSSQAIFWDFGEGARFWTSTEVDYSQAILRYINHDESTLGRDISSKGHGRSIRCISSTSSGNTNINNCYEVLLTGESIVCQGDENVTYQVISDADITEYNWQYGGTGAIIEGDSNLISISFSKTSTSGILSVIVSGDQITEKSSEIIITVKPLPDAAGYISGESVVCPDQVDHAYSIPEINNSTEYQWDYSGIGASITGNLNEVHINYGPNTTSGILSVRGINTCGSGISTDLPIEMILCNDTIDRPTGFLNIPNSFSPNGDNVNDLFIIQGLKEGTAIKIFNRNGKLLFESENYMNNWDGIDKDGNKLKTDTYWYIISIPGIETYFKGFLYIKE